MHNPNTDWCYRTEPDESMNNISIRYPRGKTLGGSSSINGLLYIRGQHRDYDIWRQAGGIQNDQEEILKSFKSLKKGGNLIINVPAFPHLYSKFDNDVGHYRRYNHNMLVNLTKKIRFSSLRMLHFDSIGYFLSLISKIF